MKNNQTLIVTGGKIGNLKRLKTAVEKADFIIAADSGLESLYQIGATPHLIVGDFDSIKLENWRNHYAHVPVVGFPAEKDYTDTELAIEEAFRANRKHILIYGATGTRQDHTMANMFLLQKIGLRGFKAHLIDDYNSVEWIEAGEYIVPKEDYKYFSLIVLSREIEVSLVGFKYPLNHRHVLQESTLTISNEFVEETGKVCLHEGRALLIRAND